MAYATEGIRSGGGRAGSAREAAESALTRLNAAIINGGAFGEVNAAAALASGLGSARDDFSRTSFDVAARHGDLNGRAQNVAAQGNALVPETTGIAQRAPGPIAMPGGRSSMAISTCHC